MGRLHSIKEEGRASLALPAPVAAANSCTLRLGPDGPRPNLPTASSQVRETLYGIGKKTV